MAESIIFNVAGSIITNLGSLALREMGLVWGVNDELEKLKDTVSTIEAVLLDADEQQSKSNAVKNWLSKLKDAFYDVDDLIDEFSYETLRRRVMTKDGRKIKEVRIFFSKSNHVAFGLKMGHRIKEIREKLDAIAANSTQFQLSGRIRDTRDDELRERRYTHSFIRVEEVIGRDADRKVMIDLLMDTNFKVDIPVIAIVGMGGLGKTALAQSVYNDEKIAKHFELKLWVCIHEEFDVKIIVEKIIESATNNRPEPLEMDLLQSKLRRKIDGKKYLLIMDDVWNDNYEKWAHLKRLLMGGAKGSKIVITTRSQQVAKTSDTTILHSLEGLSEYNSWLLFKRMAFKEGEEDENTNLIKIGKEIAAKLKGVPLAIRTIGRLLYFKRSEVDWLSFKDNELYKIMQQENEMQSILKLSYKHLPSNLKQCFVYCSLFPKDYEIEKDEVIKQWVAQGFVQPHGISKPIEDVGDDYFMELLWRSIFQDARKNEWGDIMECKMHDLMHDLACVIVENECLLANVNGRPIDKRTRHMSFHSYNPNRKLELPESLFEAKNLRTFLLRYHPPTFSTTGNNKSLLNKILSNFLRLRTLDLSTGWITKLPKSISKLRHLRYLDLSWNTHIEFLPDSITELYNLETLILRSCWRLIELPRDIKNWINLRHLDLIGCDSLTCMPKGLGGRTSLLTMSLFVLAKDDGNRLSELNGLNNLRGSLTIRGLKFCRTVDLQKNADYLRLKSGLRKLDLDWDHYKDKSQIDVLVDDDERVLECLQPHSNVREICIRGFQGVRLSNWLSSNFFVHLITVRLSSCERLQQLPQFDQFSFLRHLDLQNLICIEYIDSGESLSPSIFFPSLERLSISNMPNLKGWWKGEITSTELSQSVSLPTFPCLSQLEIIDCCQLTSIPSHPPLRSLEIGGVSMQLLDVVMKTTTNHLHMPFSSVEQCDIDGDDDDGVRQKNLGRLCSLHLQGFPRLECLPEGLQHVTTLRHFSITDFPNLMTLPEWIGNLTSLSTLTIQYCPKLTSLPEGICHLTSLTELYINNCGSLTSLFEGIHHLTSLLRLAIYRCSNLTSLPEGMCHLNSLQRLEIYNCLKLEERCKKGIGEDWPKIAHVPDLRIS